MSIDFQFNPFGIEFMFTFLFLFIGFLFILGVCILFPPFGVAFVLLASFLERFHLHMESITVMFSLWITFLFVLAGIIRCFLMEKEKWDHWFSLILIFICVTWITSLVSLNPLQAGKESFQITLFLLTAFFISRFLHPTVTARYVLFILYVCFFLSLILCFCQLSQRIEGENILLTAGFSDRNYYAIALALLLPLSAYEIRRSSTEQRQIIGIIGFFSIAVVAFSAGSRSGDLITWISIFLVIFSGIFKKNHLAWFIPAFSVFVVYTIFGNFTENIIKSLAEEEFQWRLNSNLSYLSLFAQHPFWGVGIGQYEQAIHWSYPELETIVSPEYSSLFLFFAETGIVGGILYTLLLIILFSRFVHIYHSIAENQSERYLYLALIHSIVLLILSSLIHSIHTHLLTWCYIGILFWFSNRTVNDVINSTENASNISVSE